jgi:Tol biopolymer transport system component
LVWQSKTRDRRAWVQVLEDGKGQRVRIGALYGPLYDGIGVDALSLCGNHIAYPARRGTRWLVVHDGHELGFWSGVGELAFSPDGARLAFSAERDGEWQVVVDGTAGPRFESIFAHSLTWRADGVSLAYAATRAGRAHAVLDQVPGPPFDGVGRLAFGGVRFAYVGRMGTTSSLVLDGIAGAPEKQIGEFAFSPDGAHLAYVVGRGDEEWIVLDRQKVAGRGQGHFSFLHVDDRGGLTFVISSSGWARLVRLFEVGPTYAAIPELVVTPAGRWAYLAREGNFVRAVLDGVPQPACEWASNLVASPDGKRLAYLAQRQGRIMVIHESQQTPANAAVDGSLVWSRDSRHWACLAGDPTTRTIFVSVDGIRRRPFDVQELVFLAERQSAQAPGSEERLLQEIVSGELELELASCGGVH